MLLLIVVSCNLGPKFAEVDEGNLNCSSHSLKKPLNYISQTNGGDGFDEKLQAKLSQFLTKQFTLTSNYSRGFITNISRGIFILTKMQVQLILMEFSIHIMFFKCSF